MIKINLASKKQIDSSGEGKGAKSIGGLLGNIDLEFIKDLPIKKIVIPVIIGVVASYTLGSYKDEEMSKVQILAEKAMADGEKLKKDIEKFKPYDAVKKQLEVDESAIRHKLETIQKLMSTRSDAGKMIVSISNATPPNVWFSELKVDKSGLVFKGAAVEYNQISDLMKNLNESSLLTSVELKGTEQIKEKETGVDIETFELDAKRK